MPRERVLCAPPTYQVDDQHHQRYDEQQVNQSPGYMEAEA